MILKQFGCQRKGWGVGDRGEQKGEETHTYRTHTLSLNSQKLGRRGTLVGWPVGAGGQDQSKRTEGWCGTNPGGQPCPLRRVSISPAARMTLKSQEKRSEMVSGHVLHGPHRPPRASLQWPTAVGYQDEVLSNVADPSHPHLCRRGQRQVGRTHSSTTSSAVEVYRRWITATNYSCLEATEMDDTMTTKIRVQDVWFLLPEEDLELSVDRPGPAAGSSPCSVFRLEDALWNLKSLKPTGVRAAQTPSPRSRRSRPASHRNSSCSSKLKTQSGGHL